MNADILGIRMEGPHLLLTLAGLCSLIGLTRLASHYARHYGRAGMAGVIGAGAGVVLIIASKKPALELDVGRGRVGCVRCGYITLSGRLAPLWYRRRAY